MSGAVRRAGLALVLLAAAACATTQGTTVVYSKRIPEADTAPRRVFVLSRLLDTGGPSFGPVFAKAFEGRFDAALRRCGIQTAGYASTGLETGDDIDRPLNAFRPDALVVVRMTYGTVDQLGVLLNGTIEITLYGGTTAPDGTKPIGQKPKVLWKGAAIFAHGGLPLPLDRLGFTAMAAKAEAFADDMSNRMKEDGFFPGCSLVGPRDLPAVTSPVESAGYTPASRVTASGGLSLGGVTYLPAKLAQARAVEARKGKEGSNTSVDSSPAAHPRVGPDRDQLAGDGRTRFAPGVDEYLRGALRAELGGMGIDTADARRTLRVDIQDAAVDASRWGYRISLRVKYELSEAGGGVLYSGTKDVATAPSARPMLEAEALNQVIRSSAEALVEDPEFAKAVR